MVTKTESGLGRWNIVKNLGAGKKSSVDLGYDPETNEYSAVKTIRIGFIPLIKCLKNEFELAKGLDHPNVIKYKEFYEKTDFVDKESSKYKVAALVMEPAENGELFQYVIANGGLSEPIARFYFKKIIDGLDYLHQQGLAHRDMKLENVVLDSEFNLKLTDFGFSTQLSGKDMSYELRTVLGSEYYMAPEISTKKYKGTEVDLFAAGVALFIMIKTTPPFDKADPKKSRSYKNLSEGSFDSFWALHERPRPYSPEFKDLIQKMLALEPEKRLDVETLREHPWYKGFTPELSAVQQELKNIKETMDAKIKEEELEQEKQNELQKPKEDSLTNTQGVFTGFKPYRGVTRAEGGEDIETQLRDLGITFNEDAKRSIRGFETQSFKPASQIFVAKDANTILKHLLIISKMKFNAHEVAEKKYKIKGIIYSDSGLLKISIEIFRVSEIIYCVAFRLKEGDIFTFYWAIKDKFIALIQERVTTITNSTYDKKA